MISRVMNALQPASGNPMNERLKLRVIGDQNVVYRAQKLLPELDLTLEADQQLVIDYEFPATNCETILATLEQSGIELELTKFEHLKLLLRCYREGIRRDSLNNEMGWDSFVREIYVSRYRHRRHGRRDDRPRHWRQYR